MMEAWRPVAATIAATYLTVRVIVRLAVPLGLVAVNVSV